MSTLKIAHVRWFLGQTVLPEHLQALQELGDTASELRARLSGLPHYGLADLLWSEPLLEDGVLGISSVTAILPEGQVISVPGNAILEPVSLSATGATSLPVYLHITDNTRGGEGNLIYHSDARTVERVLRHAHLSISDKHPQSRGAMKLGEFGKDADGTWRLSPSYIPPLLQVGTTPYLKKTLADLEERIHNLEPQLVAQLQDTFLRPERLQAIRRCLSEIYETLSLLADIKHKLPLHPYQLFTALRRLLRELCTFHEVIPDQIALPYRHDDLGRCFGDLFTELSRHLKPVYTRSTHLRFMKQNGLFSLAGLTEEVKSSQEVYLLIQRPTLHERIDLTEVKVSCTSRLALIHRLVLRGVPFKHIERPPFPHTFGPEVDFYQLQFGEEWNHVLREAALAFYIHPVLEKANAFLFWR
jgi:type VI secretion system protein ImpJ